MFSSTNLKDGRVLMVELRLCVKCARMIVINDEKFYRMYLPHWEGFAFAHKQCPPSPLDTPPYEQLQQ